jgi:hypothetical protein
LLALGRVVWLVWPGNELHLRTPARWRHRRTGRRQPEVLKNGLDRAAFAEEREHQKATATAVVLEHVLAENRAQQLSPGQSSARAGVTRIWSSRSDARSAASTIVLGWLPPCIRCRSFAGHCRRRITTSAST